jgi:hypothetical protein
MITHRHLMNWPWWLRRMLMRCPKPKLDDLVLDLSNLRVRRPAVYTYHCFYFPKRVSRPDPVQDPPPETKPEKQPKPKHEARPVRARAEPKPARTRTEYVPSPEEIEAAKLQIRDRHRSEMLKPTYR